MSGPQVRRLFAAAVISLVALGYTSVVVFQYSGMDLSSLRSQSSKLFPGRPNCRVPETSSLIHSQTIANYTHFSNVLLVVFFSHPRYDANLDFHREVYADYFPNVSRRTPGFCNTYDDELDRLYWSRDS